MSMMLQPNGDMVFVDKDGARTRIGPEHPEYQRYRAQYRQSTVMNTGRARMFGALLVVLGAAAVAFDWHMVMTEGKFYMKLDLFGFFSFFGGILMMVFPEASGPVRPDTPTKHKVALVSTIAVAAALGGVNLYLMSNYRP